jgi:hypothetical protein
MATVPTKIPDKIAWYQSRETNWTSNAIAIGLLTTEMTTMSAKIAAAVDALAAQTAAKNAQKSATVALNEAANLLGVYGADLIKKIRAKAGQVGGDSVYVLADVPPPATPTPVGPPGKPTDFGVELQEDGTLNLGWKCTNPAGGTMYQVWRQIGEAGTLEYLGGSGSKMFIDSTLPAGSTNVMYQIQGVRTTAIGPVATFNVKFGVNSSGAMTANVTEVKTLKKAA